MDKILLKNKCVRIKNNMTLKFQKFALILVSYLCSFNQGSINFWKICLWDRRNLNFEDANVKSKRQTVTYTFPKTDPINDFLHTLYKPKCISDIYIPNINKL